MMVVEAVNMREKQRMKVNDIETLRLENKRWMDDSSMSHVIEW